MKKIALTLSLILLSTAPAAHAAKSELDQVLAQLQKTYDSAKGYSADFEQLTGTPSSGAPKSSRGSVHFEKPGRMYWDYIDPPRKFVSNGTTFWMVQPERKEVLEAPAEKMFGDETPAAFLAGFGEVKRDFKPELIRSDTATALIRLNLKKPTTQAQYLEVQLDRKTGLAQSVKTVDFFGAYNEIRFTKYKLNPSFATDFFTYQAPKDYRIVHPADQMPQGK